MKVARVASPLVLAPSVPPMAEINLDIGHALSREDQRQNRRNLALFRSLFPLTSFSGNRAAKFSKKINKAGETEN